MKCNCMVTDLIIGIVILIFAIWPALLGATISNWIVIIAAILLILHAILHKKRGMDMYENAAVSSKAKKRR